MLTLGRLPDWGVDVVALVDFNDPLISEFAANM